MYHYSGYSKPWRFRFTAEDFEQMAKGLPPLDGVRHFVNLPEFAFAELQWFFEAYWNCCEQTPIYKQTLADSKISGTTLKNGYLPTWLWGYKWRVKLKQALELANRLAGK